MVRRKKKKRRKKRISIVGVYRVISQYTKQSLIKDLIENYLRKKLDQTSRPIIKITYKDFQRRNKYDAGLKISPQIFWETVEKILEDYNFTYRRGSYRGRKVIYLRNPEYS